MNKLFGNQYGSKWWAMLLLFVFSARAQKQPNIVLILVDDMGWNDVSFHGSDQILTPNIDTLAYSGVILQQYYSEAICTPARTALLTGKYPMRLGMHGFPLLNSEDRGIPLTERLLPSYLKELGYATHLVGKWHVGMSRPEYLPTARGYDSHYGMRGGFIDYYTYNKIERWPNGTTLFGLDFYDGDEPQENESRYAVDALTDRAVKTIQQHNMTQPLFLHLAHNAPHAGNSGAALQPPLYTTVRHRHVANSDRRLYAEVVNNIDHSVGRIVRALADKHVLDNTIIIFASDNGAPTSGNTRNWGVNLPFRGGKYTPWEGAVRVPAFIWHLSIKPRVWHGLMHITDWMPTLAAAVGARINGKLDGVNQWDALWNGGESKRNDVLIILEDGNQNSYAAYRAGDYKIIVGNVTGLDNVYYGAQYMTVKGSTPEYFPILRNSEVSRIFEDMGMYVDFYDVLSKRSAATITQEDSVQDSVLCEPSPLKGCLFNIRRDPTESHDLWSRASNIAMLLTSRLRGLWASQLRRGPANLQIESDPVYFNYIWTPWISNYSMGVKPKSARIRTIQSATTEADIFNCNRTSGIRNFFCILRSVFQ
ncbi:hypothetical protein ACJJTC_013700 [Scirpophaga incertulas]